MRPRSGWPVGCPWARVDRPRRAEEGHVLVIDTGQPPIRPLGVETGGRIVNFIVYIRVDAGERIGLVEGGIPGRVQVALADDDRILSVIESTSVGSDGGIEGIV